MVPAHHCSSVPDGAESQAVHPALSVSKDQVKLSIRGKLGFDCWRAFLSARRLAVEKGLPLQVEVRQCDEADMAGIGSLLVAIERLGSVEIVGCTDLSRHWFSNFGICQGCANRDAGPACPKRLH